MAESVRTTRARTATIGDQVVVLVLVLAGIFDWLSGNPIHGIMLLVVAGALGWDVLLRHPSRVDPAEATPAPAAAQPATSRPGTWPFVAGALLFAVLAGGFGRYSWPATVAVVIPGTLAFAIAWRGPLWTRQDPPVRLDPLGVSAWFGVFVTLGLWELVQLLLQPTLTTDSYVHPTISVMTDPVLSSHPGRSMALFLWLGLGWVLMGR